jgi:hypothetical protein
LLLGGSLQGGGFRTVTPVLRACELDLGPGGGPDRPRSAVVRLRYDPPITEDPTPVTARPDDGDGDDRVGALRGAGVGTVDAKRVGMVVVGMGIVALAVLVVVFFVAGVHKNDQITRLHQHGVPVTITVTGCLGQLGGSGSNAAGYACHGTFSLDGHRYTESIPGNTLRSPGTTLDGVALPGDPALVTTTGALATEHPSANVFVLPIVLLGVLVVSVVALVLWRRRAR